MKQMQGKWASGGLLLVVLALVLTMSGGALAGPTGAANPGGSGGGARPETLVVRLYFHDAAERDRLATEWNAEEANTLGGYLTILTDRQGYLQMLHQGLRAEIDQETTTQINNPNLFGGSSSPNTF